MKRRLTAAAATDELTILGAFNFNDTATHCWEQKRFVPAPEDPGDIVRGLEQTEQQTKHHK